MGLDEEENNAQERSDGIMQYHTFQASGQPFCLAAKYTFIKDIGTGAYGAVISAKNHETDENVAVKKIANIFEDLVDAKVCVVLLVVLLLC